MIRLFIALEIPGEIRNLIVNERKKIIESGMRWEPVEKLHLTLKFIGNFDENLVEELAISLSFIENFHSFNVSLSGYGFFFVRKSPKILWLGLSTDDNLFKLVSDLNKHLVKFKIPVEEKMFKPHLTLLRVPRDGDSDLLNLFRGIKVPEKSFIADHVILYKSELSPKGSKYTPLKVYKLKAG